VVDLVKIADTDKVGITNHASVVIHLIFEFYDRLFVGGSTITDSADIIFIRDPSDPNYILGVKVRVVNPDKQKYDSAAELGERTVNYLSGKSITPVRSKRPKIEKLGGNIPQIPTSTQQPQVFNLDASKLPSLFSSDSILIQKAANYQSGMTALEDNDLKKAVPCFYQVIENSLPKVADYYQPLRDSCSHDVLDNDRAVKALNNVFNIKCSLHKPVDFTKVSNWQQLYIHAHALKQVADSHMKKILP